MTNLLSAVLVGDELGFIKRLDLHAKAKQAKDKKILLTLNREFIGEPSPDKSVLSITPLAVPDYFQHSNDDLDDDEDDNQITSSHNYSDDFVDEPYEESNFIYLIASRPNHIYLYNSYNQRFATIVNPVEGNLVGSLPIAGNKIISCYDNGTVNVQNIETDLIAISSRSSKKACKILGIGAETTEADHSDDGDEGGPSASKKIKKSHSKSKGNKKESSKSTVTTIFSPNWQPSNVCLTCFKVQDNRVAIGGKNFDMRVFDLNTKQCIFTAKSQKRDWLGIRHKVWTSDLDWIGPFAGKQSLINTSTLVSSPSMIATASRTDPVVRIYDLKTSSRKSIWQLNFKDQTFNNDSNPPSFTKICATPQYPVNTCTPTQKIILGTTMGRMMAVDLRFNSHTCRHLGVFKCFGGGAIRDIKYVPLEPNRGKIVSCSLDRFIKIHSFSMGADRTRSLDHRYYMKTKPTCIQPIISNVLFPDQDSDNQDDEEADENDEDDVSHSIS